MKRSQRLGLMLLSACLLLTSMLAIPASADATSIKAETVVVSAPDFTITVPSGIPLGDITKTEESFVKSTTFTVGVTGVSNIEGKQVRVVLSTPYDAFCMYSGNNVLPYKVYDAASGGNELANGGTLCTFSEEGDATGRIEVDLYSIPAEGAYGGVLTFTFQVENRS